MSSLESDVAGISLPGPAAARRRAAQRTRHQLTGGVLAGVAAVALGVFAVSPPDFVASPDPAGSPSDSPTPTAVPTTPTQSPSPSTPPVEPSPDPSSGESPGGGEDGGSDSPTVPAGALLTVDDVENDTSEAWAEVDAGASGLPCVPDIPGDAAAVAYESPYDSHIEQFVDPADGAAEARLEELRDELTGCAESGGDFHLIQVWSLSGVGDAGYLLVWNGPPTTPDTQTYVTASLVRTGDFVSAVFHGGPGQDYNAPAQPRLAVLAIERLCGALGTECPTTPEQERLFPEPTGDLDGWLTTDDLAEAGLEALTDGGQVLDSGDEGGPTGYGYVAFTRDPLADGAELLEQRQYGDPMDPGGPILIQERATFADAEGARAHYAELVFEANQFSQPGDVIESTGDVSVPGYEAATWRAEGSGEFASVFVYGAAVSENVVTVVYYGVDQVDVPPEQMQQLLERAAQRIGG
ncbi:hypothetical protein DY240_10010 [Jiangella rhizosphaerae]|uniref:Uncharacterized protein n=1 Tax=Jiangella rhizosphaerae TaxID=2293569 RepID=A0A418KS95_9ACTN|nr:hypothetical protein DY240_10010 [Jiangella rhizosphaerae]